MNLFDESDDYGFKIPLLKAIEFRFSEINNDSILLFYKCDFYFVFKIRIFCTLVLLVSDVSFQGGFFVLAIYKVIFTSQFHCYVRAYRLL